DEWPSRRGDPPDRTRLIGRLTPLAPRLILPRRTRSGLAASDARRSMTSSVRGHAAVDHELAARDPGGLVGGQIEATRSNIGWGAETSERSCRQPALGHLGVGVAGPRHWRVDEAWMHRVHPDLVGGILDGGSLGEDPDRPLRGMIGGIGVRADDAANR